MAKRYKRNKRKQGGFGFGMAYFCFMPLLCATVSASPSTSLPVERVVSINLCTDQLVLLLADASQIASLTHLARDQPASYYYQQAKAYPTNKGLVEEILPYQPDLVLAGQYTSAATLALLKKLHIRVETLILANSMASTMENIRQVAGWLGQAVRGERVIQAMQQRLKHLLEKPISLPKPTIAVYDPNGYTVGSQSLRGDLLQLAGWENVAARRGITTYGALSLEDMVRLQPQALFDSPYSMGTYSRAQALAQHPALRGVKHRPRIISIPSAQTICAGPWLLDVLARLQQAREQ